ncbi:hypothetical protein DWV16_17615 [Anaerotruncus sp. AF02-27]|uniref:hypothetical protein n=1 Tax=Anaerotruncus sp. AF02-27 TaxID=2292191 RepID=UPI000E46B097|nr:hypothetical protein [Anaerotruncus sp. AF02-27]RGX52928.1 hypothetical protein DWV16_17615 [Anaerotruncus sp. AF02-27]
MAEYIEREALFGAIGQRHEIDGNHRAAQILECILEAPVADVAPVVHGRWEPYQVECGNPFSGREGMLIDVLRCSKCHAYFDAGEALNYCPNCGCKMREGKEGEKHDDQ